MSSGRSRSARAASTSSRRRAAIAARSRVSARCTTGTTSPESVATAMPTFTPVPGTIAPSCHEALRRGCRRRASAQTLTSRSVWLRASHPGLRRATARQLSSRDASTSRVRTNCGTSCQARVVRSAMTRQTVPTSKPSPTPKSAEAWAAAASTSAAVTAPLGPVPVSAPRSMPRDAASFRAFGDASGRRSAWRGVASSRLLSWRGVASPTGVATAVAASGGATTVTSACSSPGASTAAITVPTGTSAPSGARRPASVPSAGDSISTVTLSVSTSSSGSPLATVSPSRRSQRSTLPVSCAIPSAGMITSAGMRSLEARGLDDGVRDTRVVQVRRHLALRRERAGDGVLAAGAHEQLLGREAGDHLAARARHDELLLDPRRRPAVARRPERLEREDHALLDRLRIVERDEPAEDRLLPDREADAVPVLERERGLLVGEAELLGAREDLDDLGGRDAGPHHRDRLIEHVAAADVGVDERPRGGADGERAVVARAVAVVGVQNVEIGGVAGAEHPVGEDVRMRAAALARDGVDALDVLRAQLEQHLAHERDGVVLAEARPQRPVELVVRRVDHGARRVEQRDLVLRLELADVLHQGLAVDDRDALGL